MNETKTKLGQLEVECVILNKDGTVKSVEKSTRPVMCRMDVGEQITQVLEV